ncbi:hypothetical protein E4U19_002616 [Claviceps sp. Clav32 group G5]|nr:hypothetical protein E4U40_002808 [Claviceps sp. LM458 group G5]KAG6037143.1 hypothetical protein E4U19_002616 [Claviceps sp. Clav32 group G5]KAG6044988.1 hypothetical protein E4U39_002821 [Claviceps sp. Clav50 group G5]
MNASVLKLCLAILATAGTLSTAKKEKVWHAHSEKHYGKTFRLMVNVLPPVQDFPHPINHQYLSAVSVSPNTTLVGMTNDPSNVIIFYQNGTVPERETEISHILTDNAFSPNSTGLNRGAPRNATGLKLSPDSDSKTLQTVHIVDGPGDAGLFITMHTEDFVHLEPNTWLACKNDSLAHLSEDLVVLRHMTKVEDDDDDDDKGKGAADNDEDTSDETPPTGCIPIVLTPECTVSPRLSAKAEKGPSYILRTPCYPNWKPEWNKDIAKKEREHDERKAKAAKKAKDKKDKKEATEEKFRKMRENEKEHNKQWHKEKDEKHRKKKEEKKNKGKDPKEQEGESGDYIVEV